MARETKAAERAGKPQTALAERDPAAPLLKTMELMRPQFEMALPRHLDANRFYRVALTCLRTNPKLLEADRGSLLASLMQAAQLGLEPDGLLGQGFLIAYSGKVQFQPGYKGYLTLARNSGELTYFHADFVQEGDLFDYEHGTNAKLRHVPGPDRADPKKKLLYAYCHSKGRGGEVFVVLDASEVLARRDRSQGWRAAVKYGKEHLSPWATDEAAMWTKTAIRAWAKHGPQSVQKAAEIEDATDRGLVPRQVFEGSMDIVMTPAEPEAGVAGVETATGKLDAFAAKRAPAPGPQGDEDDEACRTLTAEQLEAIRARAEDAGVPIAEIEEAWGCPLAEITVDEGEDAETEVLDWIEVKSQKGAKP